MDALVPTDQGTTAVEAFQAFLVKLSGLDVVPIVKHVALSVWDVSHGVRVALQACLARKDGHQAILIAFHSVGLFSSLLFFVLFPQSNAMQAHFVFQDNNVTKQHLFQFMLGLAVSVGSLKDVKSPSIAPLVSLIHDLAEAAFPKSTESVAVDAAVRVVSGESSTNQSLLSGAITLVNDVVAPGYPLVLSGAQSAAESAPEEYSDRDLAAGLLAARDVIVLRSVASLDTHVGGDTVQRPLRECITFQALLKYYRMEDGGATRLLDASVAVLKVVKEVRYTLRRHCQCSCSCATPHTTRDSLPACAVAALTALWHVGGERCRHSGRQCRTARCRPQAWGC
jgi:hypothetical protein